MRKQVGRLALRFARGPGRQSGAWMASAASLAGIPFLALILPGCASLAECGNAWDQVLFLPRLMFMPAVVVTLMMFGSWWAQRRHARVDTRFFTALDARSDQPDRPPGEFDTARLDADLAKRTLRGLGQGAMAGGVAVGTLVMTRIALRRCDPWSLERSALPVCQDTAGWTDMLLAMEVWSVAVTALLLGFVWIVRSTSIVTGLERRRRTPAPA